MNTEDKIKIINLEGFGDYPLVEQAALLTDDESYFWWFMHGITTPTNQ